MPDPNIPTLIMVGGFLGAGKTTLILKAAEILQQQGKRVAVIVNDQDGGLVDTQHARAREIAVREVAGGCFCCRFSELAAISDDLLTVRPDVIFAEPVGSCIDLAATVMRPLRATFGDRLRLAPLTVLLDPLFVAVFADHTKNADIRYLVTQQIAEADLLCTTKLDICDEVTRPPFPIEFQLSGKTGAGVEGWLSELLHTTRLVGTRSMDVDYDRYADAEGALGWLNLHARVQLGRAKTPALFCGPLLEVLEASLAERSITIAHLKLFDRTPGSWLKVSLCANGAEPVPEGELLAEAYESHEIAINLRALADPDLLRELVLAALDETTCQVDIVHLACFRPPRPRPERRIESSGACQSASGSLSDGGDAIDARSGE